MAVAVVSYVPVIHAGHISLFRKYAGGLLFVIDRSITSGFPRIERDIRALDPQTIIRMVEPLHFFKKVYLLGADHIGLLDQADKIIMPEEDLSRFVAEKYFPQRPVEFEPVFLRWDRMASLAMLPVSPDEKISFSEFDRKIMTLAREESKRSSDWWRRIGAVAVSKGGKILYIAHNTHYPSEHSPYIEGDPRSNFNAGESIECSTAEHAEAIVIAEAARNGVSLLEASLYVTTFPCVVCARSIGRAGISRVYYAEGYSNLRGEEVLRSQDVELIFVRESS